MRTKKQCKKLLVLITLVFSIILVCQSSAYAVAVWANKCVIHRLNMYGATGNAIIQATCDGTRGRVSVSHDDPGSNAIIATILTAMSLNMTINFLLFNDFDDSCQVIRGAQLNGANP